MWEREVSYKAYFVSHEKMVNLVRNCEKQTDWLCIIYYTKIAHQNTKEGKNSTYFSHMIFFLCFPNIWENTIFCFLLFSPNSPSALIKFITFQPAVCKCLSYHMNYQSSGFLGGWSMWKRLPNKWDRTIWKIKLLRLIFMIYFVHFLKF